MINAWDCSSPAEDYDRRVRILKLSWNVFHTFRYAWRNVFSLTALAAGAGFLVLVPQAHELLSTLFAATRLEQVESVRLPHMGMFLASLVAWALSAWYAMRLLSSTRFERDADPHPAAAAWARWLNEHAPRLAPLLAVATVACTTSIFVGEKPSARWIAFVAAGVAPAAWGFAWILDRLAHRVAAGRLDPARREHPVEFGWMVAVAAAAALAGWLAWRGSPGAQEGEAWAWQHQLAALLGAILLVAFALWWRDRARRAVNLLMLAAFVLWSGAAVFAAIFVPGLWVALAALALAAGGLWLTTRRRELLRMSADPGIPSEAAAYRWKRFKINTGTLAAVAVTLALLALFAAGFSQAPIFLGTWMGSLAVLFLGLALWSFFGAMWIYLPKLGGLPALGAVPILVILAVELLRLAPDHSLRDTAFEPAAPPRLKVEEHFKAWRAEVYRDGEGGPVFLVAAAGGGLRAAFWTASTLAAVDDATCGEFGRRVYAFSGVSGGSLGIAAYLAQRRAWREEGRQPCERRRKDEMREVLGRDFLAPVLGSFVFAELARRIVPHPLENDRGTTLARSWSVAWNERYGAGPQGLFDRPFLETFPARGAQPAVLLNSTSVDTGRRVIVSNVDFARSEITDAVDLLSERRALKLKVAGLTLREAVLNSARFTYVSPAGEVRRCEEPLAPDGGCPRETVWDRVVDGGYFENSGVATLADVLDILKAGPVEGKPDVVVIVIDNSSEPVLACGRSGQRAERAAQVKALSGATAPIEAFLNVREARARLEVRRLRKRFECDGQIIDWSLLGGVQKPQHAEELHHPPLGWFLSGSSVEAMLKRVDDVVGEFPFSFPAPKSPGL